MSKGKVSWVGDSVFGVGGDFPAVPTVAEAERWFMNQNEQFRKDLNLFVGSIYFAPKNEKTRADIQIALIRVAMLSTGWKEDGVE